MTKRFITRRVIFTTLGSLTAIAVSVACGSSSQTTVAPPLDAGAIDGSTNPPIDSGSHVDAGSPQDSGGSDTGVDAGIVATPPPDFLWYVMDETSGTTAHDSSANGYDIDVPGITWSTGGIFDGATTCGMTTVGPNYRSPPITISAWVKPAARVDSPTTTGALQPYPPNVLSDDIPGVGGFSLGLNVWSAGSALSAESVTPCTAAGLCVANGTQNAADAGFSCTSPTSCNQGFVAGTEYFLTMVVDTPPDGGSTTAQIYVNGALFDQDSDVVPAASTTPPLYLGCHNMDSNYGTSRFFDGRIRDVRVYSRELGAPEVKQLYTNGPTLTAP